MLVLKSSAESRVALLNDKILQEYLTKNRQTGYEVPSSSRRDDNLQGSCMYSMSTEYQVLVEVPELAFS